MSDRSDRELSQEVELSEIVRASFALVWRYRYLWYFGVILGLGAGLPFWPLPTTADLPHTVRVIAMSDLDWILAIAIASVIAIVWGIVSIGALVRSVAAMDTGESHGFGIGLATGFRSFGRILGIHLQTGALAVALIALLAGVHWLGWMLWDPLGQWMWIVSGPVGVFVIMSWRFWSGLAVRHSLLEDDPAAMGVSVRQSWRLYWSSLGLVWEAGAIQLMIVAGFAIAAAILGMALTLPGRILNAYNWIAGIAFAGIVLIPYALAIGGWVGSFSGVFWTRFYQALNPKPEAEPEDEYPGGLLPVSGAPQLDQDGVFQETPSEPLKSSTTA